MCAIGSRTAPCPLSATPSSSVRSSLSAKGRVIRRATFVRTTWTSTHRTSPGRRSGSMRLWIRLSGPLRAPQSCRTSCASRGYSAAVGTSHCAARPAGAGKQRVVPAGRQPAGESHHVPPDQKWCDDSLGRGGWALIGALRWGRSQWGDVAGANPGQSRMVGGKSRIVRGGGVRRPGRRCPVDDGTRAGWGATAEAGVRRPSASSSPWPQ